MASTSTSVADTVRPVYRKIRVATWRSLATAGSIGSPAAWQSCVRLIANAQLCGGVQKKMIANIAMAGHPMLPVTADQPISTGMPLAAPPHTTFCEVRRLINSV